MRRMKKNIKRRKNSNTRNKRRERKKLYLVNKDYELGEYMMEQKYIVNYVNSIDDVPPGAKYTYGSSICTKCISDTSKPKCKKAKKIDTIYVTSNVDLESRALYQAQGYFVVDINLSYETPRGAVCDFGYGLMINN